MGGAITQRGLAAILEASRATSGLGDQGLIALAAVIGAQSGAESVAFFELDLVLSQLTWYAGTDGDDSADSADRNGQQPDEPFWEDFWSGACSYTEPASPFAWPQSRHAVASPAQLHASRRAYASTSSRESDRDCGLGEYVVVPLSSPLGTTRRVLLNRPPGDLPYSTWDRTALTLLQPHLDLALRRASTSTPGARWLSRREYQVLTYVKAGHDNRTIARLLKVKPSTVRKHLENTYTNLGVHNRTAALAVVFGAEDDAALQL